MTDSNVIDLSGNSPVTEKPRVSAHDFQAWVNQSMNNGSIFTDAALAGMRVLYQDADGDLDDHAHWARIGWTQLRESPEVRGIVRGAVSNYVGTGLKPQMSIKRDRLKAMGVDWTDKQFNELEFEIEEDFLEWADDPYLCDVAGVHNFAEQQESFLTSEWIGGDGIQLLTNSRRPGNDYLLRSQIIDPARLTQPDGEIETSRLRGGIRRDATGMVTHHNFQVHHPDSTLLDNNFMQWIEYPIMSRRFNRPVINHVFQAEQPEASRGMSVIRPMIKTVKGTDRFQNATLMASVIHAFLSVFFTNANKSDLNAGMGKENVVTPMKDGQMPMQEGMMGFLPEGIEPKMIKAGQPGPHIEQFSKAMKQRLAMSSGIPREVIEREFTTSYTAARAAFNQLQRSVDMSQQSLSLGLCQPTLVAFMIERVARKYYELPGFLSDSRMRAAWCGCHWRGPPRGMLDKNKEILPELELYRYNGKPLSSVSEELTGVPFRQTVRRIARDKQLLLENELQDAQQAPSLFAAVLAQQDLFAEDEPAPASPDGPPEPAQPGNANDA